MSVEISFHCWQNLFFYDIFIAIMYYRNLHQQKAIHLRWTEKSNFQNCGPSKFHLEMHSLANFSNNLFSQSDCIIR